MVKPIKMVPGAISMSLICLWQRYFTLCTENVINTSIHSRMAVFKGMHVSPATHNDEKGVKMTSRKCDYRTDTQADRHKQTSEEVVPMYRYVLQAKQ